MDGGYKISALAGKQIGVFVGVQFNDYQMLLGKEQGLKAQVATGNSHSMIPNRVSYLFDFRGPSESIDTACSSSLIAVHRAVKSIQNEECEMAIAGGVSLLLSPFTLINASQLGILSPDGKCKTFDNSANGYVKGEGIGAVLLKPMNKAIQDGDNIYAIIRGSAENHGGKASSLTAPNTEAQAALLITAYEKANIDPETVSYIEAHGTGTELGDPVEIDALKKAFRELTNRKTNATGKRNYCGIGSVKTNIGHLEPAAGIAGLIKVVLSIQKKQLPGLLNFQEQNKLIQLDDSPFYFVEKASEWKRLSGKEGEQIPLRAGISSFGFGGANAHVILEEFDRKVLNNHPGNSKNQIIVLSAKNEKNLRTYAQNLSDYLKKLTYDKLQENETLIEIQNKLVEIAADLLEIEAKKINIATETEELGFDKFILTRFIEKIEEVYGMHLSLMTLSNYTTIQSLSAYLSSKNTHSPDQTNRRKTSISESGLFESIAYTLQTGREAMDERLAVISGNIRELVDKLDRFIKGEKNVADLFYNNIKNEKTNKQLSDKTPADQNGNTNKIAELWITGSEIDWDSLYTHKPNRCPLPTYPFDKKRFWIHSGKAEETDRISKDIQSKENDDKIMKIMNSNSNKIRLKKIMESNHPLNDYDENTNYQFTNEVPSPNGPSLQKDKMIEPDNSIKNKIKEILASVLYVESSELDENAPVKELGIDSILGVELINKLNNEYQLKINASELYNHPTLNKLAKFIEKEAGGKVNMETKNSIKEPGSFQKTEKTTPAYNLSSSALENNKLILSKNTKSKPISPETEYNKTVAPEKDEVNALKDIAVIGISGRFAEAKNLNEFWELLKQGTSCIREAPEERWDNTRFFDPGNKSSNSTISKWGSFLNDIDKFDPLFFNIAPKEAELMDPQQRLLLEEAWKAIEDAGYSPDSLSGKKVGVFIGANPGDYMEQENINELPVGVQMLTGSSNSIMSGRISYTLNLCGPNMVIDTACSSSLVALHQGCSSILNEESEMVLAGGVFIQTTPKLIIMTSKAGMLSKDGKCKVFDNSADGFVTGEGVGMVVLKSLQKAIEDKDHIYAVIKGSLINQDGKSNGILAPNGETQTRLELDVYKKYKINPQEINYVEAHGTGTKLGDPIEVNALIRAFRAYTDQKQYCAIGSVKSNIGHSLAAAGIASFLKVILCLKHKMLVPSINIHEENEHIDFKNSPFYVNTKHTEWKKKNGALRKAAISSFGFSGTNCHLIVEEFPTTKSIENKSATTPAIIAVSARNKEQLKAYVKDFIDFLNNNEDISLQDIAFTLQTGRRSMEERVAIIATGIEELKKTLNEYIGGKSNIKNLYTGNIRHKEETSELLLDGEEGEEFMKIILKRKKIDKLARLWTSGIDIDWRLLYTLDTPQRISLPPYHFEKKRYWFNSFRQEDKNNRLHTDYKKAPPQATGDGDSQQ